MINLRGTFAAKVSVLSGCLVSHSLLVKQGQTVAATVDGYHGLEIRSERMHACVQDKYTATVVGQHIMSSFDRGLSVFLLMHVIGVVCCSHPIP